MHQLLNSSQQQYERSSSGHRSQELHHIQQEQRSSSPDLQWRRRAWSMTRTLRLILAGWQAPSELIDHCWEVFWIHLSCRETALQQHRHWATEGRGDGDGVVSAVQHVLQDAEWNINTHWLFFTPLWERKWEWSRGGREVGCSVHPNSKVSWMQRCEDS